MAWGRGDTGRRASVDGHLEVDSVEKFEPLTPLDGSEDERRRKEQFQGQEDFSHFGELLHSVSV